MTDTTVASGDKIRCDACPVMCYIKPGAAGACDRYANHDGKLVRVDPHVILERTALPSISTVQAPHCANPQPNFAAFSARSLRST